MLDFEDEVDAEVVMKATRMKRPKIYPPHVKDLELKETAGGGTGFELPKTNLPHESLTCLFEFRLRQSPLLTKLDLIKEDPAYFVSQRRLCTAV